MYGESVFTTMRVVNGILQDWEMHFERLRNSVEFVYGPFPADNSWIPLLRDRLENAVSDIQGNKILRLTLFREQQGRGLLRNPLLSVTDLRIHLHETSFDPALNSRDERMMRLRTCPVTAKPSWWPAFLKAGNYLNTILSQKIYLQADDDDLLFLSDKNTILETSVSNIFVVSHGRLLTPPCGPDVLEGVMRNKVLNLAHVYFTSVSEAEVTLDQLMRADAVFCSNSVRGIFLVDRIDDHEITYSEEFLEKFKSLKNKVLL